jgi:hypothetical protein
VGCIVISGAARDIVAIDAVDLGTKALSTNPERSAKSKFQDVSHLARKSVNLDFPREMLQHRKDERNLIRISVQTHAARTGYSVCSGCERFMRLRGFLSLYLRGTRGYGGGPHVRSKGNRAQDAEGGLPRFPPNILRVLQAARRCSPLSRQSKFTIPNL